MKGKEIKTERRLLLEYSYKIKETSTLFMNRSGK